MKIMGCDVIPTTKIGDFGYERFLKQTSLQILKAPVRMRGLTASGMKGRCYFNVENLVEVFGGKCILGWAVTAQYVQYPDDNFKRVKTICLFGHAMWLNNKGKLSDPTAKSWMTDEEKRSNNWDFWRFMKEGEKVFVQFIPIKESQIDHSLAPKTITLEHVSDRNGQTIEEWTAYEEIGSNERIKIEWSEIDETFGVNMLHDNGWGSEFLAREMSKQVRHEIGKFTEVSLVTGKTLEEIRDKKITEAATEAKIQIQMLQEKLP